MPTSELVASEQPPVTEPEHIECPICKRSFRQDVFAEIHNQNNHCRRVFIGKLTVYDSQAKRVNWNEEM